MRPGVDILELEVRVLLLFSLLSLDFVGRVISSVLTHLSDHRCFQQQPVNVCLM